MTDALEEARRLSAAVFGNRHFAAVVAAIKERMSSEAELVTARELARAAALSDSTVRPVLLRLAEAGVLLALPKAGHARTTQYYQPVPGLLWTALGQMANAVRGDQRSESRPSPAGKRSTSARSRDG